MERETAFEDGALLKLHKSRGSLTPHSCGNGTVLLRVYEVLSCIKRLQSLNTAIGCCRFGLEAADLRMLCMGTMRG